VENGVRSGRYLRLRRYQWLKLCNQPENLGTVGFARSGFVVIATCEQAVSANTLLVALAVINGIYNCFFWTTQRSLFLQRVTPANSGRQYGNLQIVVSAFLKTGILIGGLLLENIGMLAILAVSALLSLVLAVWFYRTENFATTIGHAECSFWMGSSCFSRVTFGHCRSL